MPYKLTSVVTKPNLSVPNFDVWLSTVPQSVLAPFPDATGKTPLQVIEESVTMGNLAAGFISASSVPDDDDLVWTGETIWESKAHWEASTQNMSFTSGNTQTAGSFLRQLYRSENNITVEKFEANI